MDVAIFLVPGTFSRNAPWVQANSLLRQTLGRAFGTNDFTTVPWSGANTTHARSEAAANLAGKLRESLVAKPSHRHIVIGHSHGGTAALETVVDPEFRAKVSLVLLSTPILVARRRKFSFPLGWTLAVGAYFSATLLLVLLAVGISNRWLAIDDSRFAGFVSVTAMVVSAVGLSLLSTYVRRLSHFVVEKNQAKVPSSTEVLITRESADEAIGFLGAFQLCTRFIGMPFSVLESGKDLLKSWTSKAAGEPVRLRTILQNIVLIGGALLCVWGLLHSFGDVLGLRTMEAVLAIVGIVLLFNRQRAVGLADHAFFVVLSVMLIPLWMVCFPIWLALAIVLFPIREAILVAPFVDLSAETTPEGTWSVHHFIPNSDAFRGWGLAHWAAYNDERVLKLIVDWITNGKAETIPLPTDSRRA